MSIQMVKMSMCLTKDNNLIGYRINTNTTDIKSNEPLDIADEEVCKYVDYLLYTLDTKT